MKGTVTHPGSHPNFLSIKNTSLDSFKKKFLLKLLLDFEEEHLKMLRRYFRSNKSIRLIDKKFDTHSNSNDNHMI